MRLATSPTFTKGHRSLGYRFAHGLAVGDIAYHPDLRSRLCSAGSQLPYWENDRRRLRPHKRNKTAQRSGLFPIAFPLGVPVLVTDGATTRGVAYAVQDSGATAPLP